MTASATYTTEAVVLRLTDYGEADRIVTLLTAAHGKLTAMAKGARRSRKRFGAALAPFGHGEATLREVRGRDMPILEGLYGARGFPHLSLDLARMSHASYACELCRELCPTGEPEPEVLRLLLALLGYLDALPEGARPRVEPLRIFELRLLSAVGLGLALRGCAACGKPAGVPPDNETGEGFFVAFDPVRGGVLCPTCASGAQVLAARLPEPVRRALLALEGATIGEPGAAAGAAGAAAATVVLPPDVLLACRDVLLGIIRNHLGHNPRAVEFIAKLNLLHL